MKKRILMLAVVMLLAVVAVSAAKIDPADMLYYKELAATMSTGEKHMLYETNKANSGLAFGVNALLGAGIGSYIQGDSTGGTIALVGDLVSYAIVGLGYGLVGSGAVAPEVCAGLVYGGLATMIGFRIYEMVRPFTFAKAYNNALRTSIFGAETQVALVPTYQNEKMGLALVASAQF